jgi:hypothetical protein
VTIVWSLRAIEHVIHVLLRSGLRGYTMRYVYLRHGAAWEFNRDDLLPGAQLFRQPHPAETEVRAAPVRWEPSEGPSSETSC